MTTPEEVASDMNQLFSAPTQKKEDAVQPVALAPKIYLDKKILEEGQSPRLMEPVKDETGNLMIPKYAKLTKPIWQKYRVKPQCRPLHFICEPPLFVIEDLNVTYLIPEDFQFLGALYNQWGNDSMADQFFNEALKSSTADAYINAGVFRYRRGERGVVDNFYVAKKHFNKALGILHQMPLTVDEKHVRRKLGLAAIDEIEYRFAPLFDKIFRFIIRLLTFQFEVDVHYIGAAAPKERPEEKLREMTDGILKREFEFKKEAAKKFINDLHEKIPVAQSHLEAELQEIHSEYGGFQSPEMLDVAVTRLGEFYSENLHLLEPQLYDSAQKETEEASPVDRSIEAMCFELASFDEIEKISAKYKLVSIGELVDMAGRPTLDKVVMAWLLRDKMDQVPIMERLAGNPSAPEDIKQVIRQRHSLP